jgi:hypothetical protein
VSSCVTFGLLFTALGRPGSPLQGVCLVEGGLKDVKQVPWCFVFFATRYLKGYHLGGCRVSLGQLAGKSTLLFFFCSEEASECVFSFLFCSRLSLFLLGDETGVRKMCFR